MRAISVAILLAISSGPAVSFTDIPPEEANVYPTNWRGEILADLRDTIIEHGSIRDAQISAPQLRNMGAAERYVACIRMNGKNSFGGYTGRQVYMAVFVRGHLLAIGRPTGGPLGQCAAAEWKPFREAEKL